MILNHVRGVLADLSDDELSRFLAMQVRLWRAYRDDGHERLSDAVHGLAVLADEEVSHRRRVEEELRQQLDGDDAGGIFTDSPGDWEAP